MKQLLRFQQNGYSGYFLSSSLGFGFRIVIFLCLLLSISQLTQAQCSVTISKVTVSGCYQNNGQSKATVSVEVAWTGAPSNDSIKVELGAQIRYIQPGQILVAYPQPPTYAPGYLYGHQVIVTPQVVAYEINADGTTGSIKAAFVGNSGCLDTDSYTAPASCQPIVCGVNQLGGMVYRDFNSNGSKENTETYGVANVTVTAYDCAGTAFGPVTTDASGKYAFNSASMKYPVRVEFSGLTGLNSSTIRGTGSATTVQFIEQATCDANLGIINPLTYCQDSAQVFVPCYVYGDPLAIDNTSNSSGNSDALVSIPYGVDSKTFVGMEHMALAKEVGTVWGLGYNRFTKDLFLAANLHRHAGLGPLGLGGIYVTHTTGGTFTTEQFVDVATDLNINVGSIPANNSIGRGLISDKTKPSVDSAAFYKIGKVGIGGLEVSEDGSKLWFTNLFDKKLYSVGISAYNTSQTKPTQADVSSFTLPNPGCTGGEARPWAVKVYDNKVYVGMVCDAFTSQNKSNLRAYVYALSGNTFTQVFDFPLTYPKGYGISPLNSTGAAGVDSTGWYPWTDNFKKMIIPISNNPKSLSLVRPQPILSDIDFDIDGSMVLGFADRTGMQGGFDNYPPTGASDTLYKVNPASGDILRAYFSNGTYILENNGKVGPATGVGVNNNQGPGFGEFYDDNYNDGTKYAHTELALGGLALKPGSGQVLGTTIDPFKASPNSGGVKVWDNNTGTVDNSYVIYNASTPGTFAKASGLGEPDLNCDILTTLEIGNRVWVDTDKDGVQDPCEKALKNVNVSLYKGNTLIAATQTNANGEYYFSSKSKIGTGTWSGIGADTTILPTTAYKLVFGTGSQISAGGDTLKVTGLGKFLLTQKDATTNTGNDLNDSDAAKTSIAGGSYPTIEVTTGILGTVNHTYDAGFYCINLAAGNKIVQVAPKCNVLTPLNDGKIQLTAAVAPYDKFRVKTGTAAWSGDTTYATATAIGSTFPLNLKSAVPNAGATYVIRFYIGECCYKDTVITIAPVNCNCTSPVVVAAPLKQNLCEGGTIAAFTATSTPSAGVTYKWYGPLSDTTGSLGTAIAGETNPSFTPTANFTGTKYYAVIATGAAPICADTAFVAVTVNPRPAANVTPKKQTICVGDVPGAYTATPSSGVSYAWYGALADTTGSLGTAIGGATSATFTPSGSDITTVGTKYYAVIITDTQSSCKDTAFVQLTVNAKPNAGTDLTGGAAICNLAATVDLPDAANGESWSQLGSTPKSVTINATTGVVTGIDAIGTYQFILKNPTTGCADTVSVETKNCAKGSIGDFVWKDVNDNGIQDLPAEKGVKGVIVQLLNSDTNAVLATDTTDASGIYGFTGLDSGNYKVKIVLSSLPDTCQISPKQDVATGGGNDTNDSDFNPATGLSPVIVINTLGTGLAKDNPTIDAALFVPCVKPAAGINVAVCQGITTVDLKDAGTGEVWSKGTQPSGTSASINASTGVVTGLSSVGDYFFILTYKGQALCSDTVKVTVTGKPNAGADSVGVAAICNTIGTINLPDAANGESWSQLGTAPKAVTINAATGVVTGMDAIGTYQFILKNPTTGCADTVSVETKNCAKGSIGDFVWKDVNDNGIQDLPAEKGVKGVIVQLLNSDTNAVLATDTTDASGIYGFTGLDSGNYKVKIVLGSLPDTCKISSKQDVTTGGGNDTNDSDFNPTTGLSPVIVINTLGTGLAKDNPTIDAALVIPCVKPTFTLTNAPVCSADVQTYSLSFSVAGKNGTVKVDKGTLTGSNPYTVSGIPSGATLRITDSLSAVCKFDTLITGPNCNCNPPLPILIAPSLTACIGDTFPTIKAQVVGLATVEWFTTASGGTPVFTGLNFKPSGVVLGDTVFYAQARSTDPTCPTAISTSRVAATVNAQNCVKVVDLALKKFINTKIAQIGDTLLYSLKVWNESNVGATGVEVTDSIATTVGFIANSFVASRGSAAITGSVIKWTIGNIAANGDTVVLSYKVKATQQGIHFNTAEISKTNEKDIDSTPGNGKDEEDDIDRQCFTVPFKLCPASKIEASVSVKYTNVQWFKDGGNTAIATGNVVLLSDVGTYTFTATNTNCPTGGCCPIIIEPGDNCCPEDLCIPFTIKKTKKGK